MILAKRGLGGEIWHSMFAARCRMLEYTIKLEKKIAAAALASAGNTSVTLALCGAGFHWNEGQLGDFVYFYRTGAHRGDDPLAKVEADHVQRKKITLNRMIDRFACIETESGQYFTNAFELERQAVRWAWVNVGVHRMPAGWPGPRRREPVFG